MSLEISSFYSKLPIQQNEITKNFVCHNNKTDYDSEMKTSLWARLSHKIFSHSQNTIKFVIEIEIVQTSVITKR